MTFMELIRSRRSVRTFDGSALKSEDAERILACANAAGNPYGIPIEWRLLSAKKDGLSSPVIVGADTYIAGKMTLEAHAEEAFGYAFEEIVLFAQSLVPSPQPTSSLATRSRSHMNFSFHLHI